MTDVDDDTSQISRDVDDVTRVSCERCNRTWTLEYELEDMALGNQALEQFALDHHRHTGHFPDDISTWQATCRQCPESVERLEERGARRWAEIHARHTTHAVDLTHKQEGDRVIEAEE